MTEELRTKLIGKLLSSNDIIKELKIGNLKTRVMKKVVLVALGTI